MNFPVDFFFLIWISILVLCHWTSSSFNLNIFLSVFLFYGYELLHTTLWAKVSILSLIFLSNKFIKIFTSLYVFFCVSVLFYSPLTVLPNNFTVNWSHFVVVQCQVFARYKSHVSLIFESMCCRWFRMSLWCCWCCCFLPLKPETLPRANILNRKTYSQMYGGDKMNLFIFRYFRSFVCCKRNLLMMEEILEWCR